VAVRVPNGPNRDPGTLEELIDALERLRDAQLIVGVISYVPEVAAPIGEGSRCGEMAVAA
jgi:DNA repair exonuclease SbcCD ATPase subunit